MKIPVDLLSELDSALLPHNLFVVGEKRAEADQFDRAIVKPIHKGKRPEPRWTIRH